MSITIDRFVDEYSTALESGTAAMFVGAGLSKPAGLADWRTLMRGIAAELALDIDQEHDLVSLAQFHVNERGNRGSLNDLLIREFTKDVKVTRNHELIASLPIHTVWTTNYDTLIEEAFRAIRKRVDVKITKETLATTPFNRDVCIYKMHGDISLPHEAVLTRDDYESYDLRRSLFSTQLKGDLVSKTFLFLGFSFTDPNIDYVLSRIRVLMGENQRTHYCIMRRPEKPNGSGRRRAQSEYNSRRMNLRIADLKRYNIQAVLVDDFMEITEVLGHLVKRSGSKNIFVSGSAAEYSPLGREKLEGLCRLLGREIIKSSYNLVSGFGLGIGGLVILGATEERYQSDDDGVSDRISLWPFPRETPAAFTKAEFHTKYRKDMISRARFAVIVSGNRRDDRGAIDEASGVLEEYEIAKSVGAIIIPLGATGHAAARIWEEASKNLPDFYGGVDVKTEFKVIGDSKKTPAQIVGAAMAMIAKLSTFDQGSHGKSLPKHAKKRRR